MTIPEDSKVITNDFGHDFHCDQCDSIIPVGDDFLATYDIHGDLSLCMGCLN